MERELEKTECLCKCEETSIVSSRDNLLLCSFRIALGEDDANFCKPTKTLWKEKFFCGWKHKQLQPNCKRFAYVKNLLSKAVETIFVIDFKQVLQAVCIYLKTSKILTELDED